MEHVMKTIFIVAAMLSLAGCATGMDPYTAQAEIAKHRAAEAKSYADALWQIAQGGDTTVRTVAAITLGNKIGATGQGFHIAPSRTMQLIGALAGPITSVGLGYFGMKQGIAGINAQRDVGLSTNQAFQVFGAEIGAAAVQGYQYIQAPQPNVGGSIVGGNQYGDYSGMNSGNSGSIAGGDIMDITTQPVPIEAHPASGM
jgi:hypothetical protein